MNNEHKKLIPNEKAPLSKTIKQTQPQNLKNETWEQLFT